MNEWRSRAVCFGTFNPDFFAEPGGRRDIDRARTICARCPVTVECLDYALATSQRHGVWAGLTEKERRKVKRQREAA